MCGIAGFIHFDYSQVASKETLKRMTDIIAHRGPDGEGFFTCENIALGHRRLSIIDLSTGDQPMISKDGNEIIVFNGEIYNYIELRAELKNLGHTFKTESDTEVILAAYKEWGENCQAKLNGMWAFAIWDKSKHTLFISRDRVGEKPLYYGIYQNTLFFASEIKSILAAGFPAKFNEEIEELYLALSYIPAPYTAYKNIFKLHPGHYLSINNRIVNQKEYWNLPELDEMNMLTNKAHIHEEFESLFKSAVELRMRSDVSFGAFLSGGLDSASVVALMSEISEFPIETFTMGFDHEDFDETDLAKLVAVKFKTNHHQHKIQTEVFDDALSKVLFHYDEPFGDSSAIPTGYISSFARKKVKMVLTGDGGDELLSGYNSYKGLKLTQTYKKTPRFLRQLLPHVFNVAGSSLRGKYRYKVNKLAKACVTANLDFNSRMIQKIPYTDLSLVKSLITTNSAIKIEDYFNDFMSKCSYKDEFYKLMYYDFKLKLPGDMLVKVDRMSMAHSLETRVPFLDYRLIEFMVRVDKNVKMQGFERKSVLRNSVAKRLPEELLKAPKKGFGVPLREWFKDDSLENHLKKLCREDFGLNTKTIKEIIQKNLSSKQDFGNFIWGLIVYNKWKNELPSKSPL